MKFKLIKKLKSGVRIGHFKTKHGIIHSPFFMPVGTIGSVKGISPEELINLGAEILLANTYHLYLRPGEKTIKKLGGLHQFMGWGGPILTDSGGYQVFSLGGNKVKSQTSNLKSKEKALSKNKSLVRIMDEGVEFTSHLDGSKHLFTPEKVIQIQLDLGVDILMPLDYCPSGKATPEEVKRSAEFTLKWAKQSKKYFDKKIQSSKFKIQTKLKIQNPKIINNETVKQCNNLQASPALFGIVQGGLDSELRKYCAEELIKLDFDGYAVGGLAVDHETRDMWKTVELMGKILPENKLRYLMGVGTPDDIIAAIYLGMDMFDCVLPTRLARHGCVYIKSQITNHKSQTKKLEKSALISVDDQSSKFQLINLLNSKFRTDGSVIDKNCGCPACKEGKGFSKAYISHLIRENEMLGMRLATLHNLYQYLELVKKYQ